MAAMLSAQVPCKASDFRAPPGLEPPSPLEVPQVSLAQCAPGGPPGLCSEEQLQGRPLQQTRARFMSECLELQSARLAHENMMLRAHLQAQQVHMASALLSGAAASSLWSSQTLSPPGQWASAALLSPRVDAKIEAKIHASRALSKDSTAVGSEAAAPSSEESGSEDQPKTTVIMRNIPNSYTRSMFLSLLDREGFAGQYDLVYLPIDFDSKSGLGYSFVNLVTPQAAARFRSSFQGFTNWDVLSDKVCDTMGAVAQQGLRANVDRYRNSAVMHESVPDEYRPVIFSGGVRVPFPAPTRRLKAPHARRRSVSSLD